MVTMDSFSAMITMITEIIESFQGKQHTRQEGKTRYPNNVTCFNHHDSFTSNRK